MIRLMLLELKMRSSQSRFVLIESLMANQFVNPYLDFHSQFYCDKEIKVAAESYNWCGQYVPND